MAALVVRMAALVVRMAALVVRMAALVVRMAALVVRVAALVVRMAALVVRVAALVVRMAALVVRIPWPVAPLVVESSVDSPVPYMASDVVYHCGDPSSPSVYTERNLHVGGSLTYQLQEVV